METTKKKGKKLGWLILAIVLVAGLLIFAVITNSGVKEADVPEGTEAPSEYPDVCIETPYCTLYYPGQWNQYLIIKNNGDSVGFYAKVGNIEEQYLFEIYFGNIQDETLGKILAKDGSEVNVSVGTSEIIPDADWDPNVVDTLFAMQEDINYVLEHISFLEEIVEDSGLESVTLETDPVEYEDLVLEYPYGQLYYPGQWKDNVRFEYHEGETVLAELYATVGNHPEIGLFQIIFDRPSSANIGVFTTADGETVGVNVVMGTFEPDDSWSLEEQQIVVSMQEGINHMLEKLELAEIESDVTEELPIQEEEEIAGDILIDTPYIQLKFPEKWKDSLSVECVETNYYTVAFYGKAAGVADIHLFSICFNNDSLDTVATISTSDGESVSVGVIFEDLLFEVGTDQETMDMMYEMQEDLNYLLDNL